MKHCGRKPRVEARMRVAMRGWWGCMHAALRPVTQLSSNELPPMSHLPGGSWPYAACAAPYASGAGGEAGAAAAPARRASHCVAAAVAGPNSSCSMSEKSKPAPLAVAPSSSPAVGRPARAGGGMVGCSSKSGGSGMPRRTCAWKAAYLLHRKLMVSPMVSICSLCSCSRSRSCFFSSRSASADPAAITGTCIPAGGS